MAMGFIKHALIGIAIYEVAKYYINKDERDLIAAESAQFGNGKTGLDPQLPLTGSLEGQGLTEEREDPWKNSLANDELRAPDS